MGYNKRHFISIFILVCCLMCVFPSYAASKKQLTVKMQKKSVTLKKTCRKGDRIQIRVRVNKKRLKTSAPKYGSSNQSVVSVSKKGVMTMKKAGHAKVTVSYKKKKAYIVVTVTGKRKGGGDDDGDEDPVGTVKYDLEGWDNGFVKYWEIPALFTSFYGSVSKPACMYTKKEGGEWECTEMTPQVTVSDPYHIISASMKDAKTVKLEAGYWDQYYWGSSYPYPLDLTFSVGNVSKTYHLELEKTTFERKFEEYRNQYEKWYGEIMRLTGTTNASKRAKLNAFKAYIQAYPYVYSSHRPELNDFIRQETGAEEGGNCYTANGETVLFARWLGLDARLVCVMPSATGFGTGTEHFNAYILIDGEERHYDATPYNYGHNKDWTQYDYDY